MHTLIVCKKQSNKETAGGAPLARVRARAYIFSHARGCGVLPVRMDSARLVPNNSGATTEIFSRMPWADSAVRSATCADVAGYALTVSNGG